MFGSSSAGGGITNTGTISGRHTGIAVVGIATFAGAIANISGGRIASKTQAGILVSRVAAFGGGGAGGIFNSGTISAKTGISIADSTITGAIFDFGGSILATSHGIVIGSGSEISAASLTTFTAIGVASAARFLGGIVNSGMLVGLSKGMAVVSISTFTGGIVNGGTITGAQSPGMFIASVSRFSGGIVNSGTISGAGAGIQLESIKTFAGGVSNTGTIAGTIGIDVLNMQGLSIFDAGAIIGSGGTAIELAGSGNTLTLGAGYVISRRRSALGQQHVPAAAPARIRSTSAPSARLRSTRALLSSTWSAAPGRSPARAAPIGPSEAAAQMRLQAAAS